LPLDQDLWERGFQLAYFLFPERGMALRILTGALNKLRVQRGREIRRSYWRDKHLKRGITRITRDESDALQWLIFSESDLVEKQQEDAGAASPPQMVVRYIKNLVRMTTSMSSFYVNIGLHRLLYNYSTAETQRVYEAVTERFLGADEYRRAKSALMKKLMKRFHGMLKTLRAQHGELRFETSDQQEFWARLVDTCLKAFTPWSTLQACPVPQDYDASRDKLPSRLSGAGGERVDVNQIEINRCHAFIDPICDGRLMEALLLQPPVTRLALPRFYMNNQPIDNDPTHSERPSGLTAEELDTISKQLSDQARRRKQADPQSVIVVVDGEERAHIQLKAGSSQIILLEEGDSAIELRAPSGDDDVLLAMIPLAYTEASGLAAAEEILWRGRNGNLALNIAPAALSGEEPAQATATIKFEAKSLFGAIFQNNRHGWSPRLAFAGLALVLASVGIRYAVQHSNPKSSAPAIVEAPANSRPSQSPEFSVSPTPLPQVADAHISYRLVPDEQATRGPDGNETVIALPAGHTVINLELPVQSDYAQENLSATLKLFFQPGVILKQNNLHAKKVKNDLLVTLAVPSEKLKIGEEYAVELQTGKPGQHPETIESYGFQTKKRF
jgi:hypothetical protein